MSEVLLEVINEIQLALISICCLLVIIHIFLDYRWKLDVLHKLESYFSKINEKYSNDSQNRLSNISDEVQKLSREWNKTMDNSVDRNVEEDEVDDLSGTLDDLFNRYG